MAFDWKKALGGIAPTLAAALGGPAAGKAVAVLSSALFGHPNGSDAEVAAAVAGASPEQIAAIQKAENDFTLALLDRANEADKILASDRQDARAMQKSNPSRTPAILTYGALGLFATTLVLMFLVPVPASNQLNVNAIVEVLKLLNVTAFGFWLGGSFGSEQKTAILGRMIEKK